MCRCEVEEVEEVEEVKEVEEVEEVQVLRRFAPQDDREKKTVTSAEREDRSQESEWGRIPDSGFRKGGREAGGTQDVKGPK